MIAASSQEKRQTPDRTPKDNCMARRSIKHDLISYEDRISRMPEEDRFLVRPVFRRYKTAVKVLLEVEHVATKSGLSPETISALRSRLLGALSLLDRKLSSLGPISFPLEGNTSEFVSELAGWYTGTVLNEVLSRCAPALGIKDWEFSHTSQWPSSIGPGVTISFVVSE